MALTSTQIRKFETEVARIIDLAVTEYDIRTFNSMDVDIRFDLRGRAAGQACRKFYTYILRFNVEAMEKDWDHMFTDTIPHEVAHLVCFAKPELGRNHDKGWKRVARSLGSTGDRTHSLKLTSAKKTVKFKYVLDDGTEVELGARRHARVQNGTISLYMRPAGTVSGRKMDIRASHYASANAPRPITKKVVRKTVNKAASKKLITRRVFDAHFGTETRKRIIEMMVLASGTTPAGAASYYQMFKKALEQA